MDDEIKVGQIVSQGRVPEHRMQEPIIVGGGTSPIRQGQFAQGVRVGREGAAAFIRNTPLTLIGGSTYMQSHGLVREALELIATALEKGVDSDA